MKATDKKGSVTIEAAIVLPLFICVVMTLVSVIKVAYTHDAVQSALDKAAEEIASYTYAAHALGYTSGSVEGSQIMDSVFAGLSLICGGEEKEKEGHFANALKKLTGNILKEGAEYAFMQVLADEFVRTYIETSEFRDADKRLRLLGVVDGFSGLDFRGSGIFAGNSDDIVVAVRYRIKIPVPLSILKPLEMEQKAVAAAWMGGDDPRPADEEDIWSLDNLSRGRRVREIFKANLPWYFPEISAFKNGTAILIRSIDLTAASYQDMETMSKTIRKYIDDIFAYNGQIAPWGDEKITIGPEEIIGKQLLLVIPRNPVSENVTEILGQCADYASEKDILLVIEPYGVKKGVPD